MDAMNEATSHSRFQEAGSKGGFWAADRLPNLANFLEHSLIARYTTQNTEQNSIGRMCNMV